MSRVGLDGPRVEVRGSQRFVFFFGENVVVFGIVGRGRVVVGGGGMMWLPMFMCVVGVCVDRTA